MISAIQVLNGNWIRLCLHCGSIIRECMGSVIGDHLLEALDGKRARIAVRERCGRCTIEKEMERDRGVL